jgi:hypothetical protein
MIQKGVDKGIEKFNDDVRSQVCRATTALVQERAKELIRERHKPEVEKAAIDIANRAIDALGYISPQAFRLKK